MASVVFIKPCGSGPNVVVVGKDLAGTVRATNLAFNTSEKRGATWAGRWAADEDHVNDSQGRGAALP